MSTSKPTTNFPPLKTTSGSLGPHYKINITVEHLKQRHQLIDRFAIVRLIEPTADAEPFVAFAAVSRRRWIEQPSRVTLA
jgi:hypothetical protein